MAEKNFICNSLLFLHFLDAPAIFRVYRLRSSGERIQYFAKINIKMLNIYENIWFLGLNFIKKVLN